MSNAIFLANPKTFCDTNALHPVDAPLMPVRGAGGNFWKVPTNQRVSYCQIVPGVANIKYGWSVGINSNCYSAQVSVAAPPDPANWFPVYYLPWGGGQCWRTTLTSHQGGLDPDIFITSAVNGCSVFIEGDPAHPTVYHVNNTGGVQPGPNSGVPTLHNYWGQKQATMEGWVNATMNPRSVQVDQNVLAANPSKAVHALDYMDVRHAHKDRFQNDPNVVASVKAEAKATHTNIKKVRFESVEYDPCGTVFGWRQGGNWTFYFQKRSIMLFFVKARKKGFGVGTERPQQPICREFPIETREFWPNGGGQVFARNFVPNPVTQWLFDFNV